MNRGISVVLLIVLARVSGAQDWKPVEAAMGRAGVAQAGDVYRFNFPRGDMRVMVGDVQVKPALALGGWVAFKKHGDAFMAMGDLVLADSEVTPVLTRLQLGGVEQTAIHHHLLHESPRVLYMHIHAHGDAVKIAETIKAAMALTAAPAPAAPPTTLPAIDLDTAAIAKVMGASGKANGGVLQFSFPRVERIHEGDFDIPPSMGLGTAINFQPTGSGKAAITGDFVMRGNEVNQVIRVLRANGIEATSLHSHLLGEEPRLYFMHFWANDDALKLARGLRSALDKTNSKR